MVSSWYKFGATVVKSYLAPSWCRFKGDLLLVWVRQNPVNPCFCSNLARFDRPLFCNAFTRADTISMGQFPWTRLVWQKCATMNSVCKISLDRFQFHDITWSYGRPNWNIWFQDGTDIGGVEFTMDREMDWIDCVLWTVNRWTELWTVDRRARL